MTAAPTPETTAALVRLAGAVDADRGAQLYLDRGDGVLELVVALPAGSTATIGEASAGSGPRSDEHGRLRRWLAPSNRGAPGAVARLALPEERGGLLVLERKRSEPFSEEDLALARVQARRLVGTVTTRLGPRPITWSAQLEAVQSVAAQLTRLTSVEEVSSALCSQTQRVVAFDNARVYVLCEDGRTLDPVAFRPHASEYQGESASGLRVTVGEGITGWVANTGQPLNVPDANADPRAVDIPGSVDLAEESMLLAPLRSEGRVIGVVVLSRLGLGRFSDDELRLLGVLADQAAVAIENARLLAERERHVSELAALLDISQAGGGSSNELELAGVLAAKLRSAAGMDSCLISRWDEQRGNLVAIGASGRPLEGQERDVTVHRAARQVLISDQPLRLDPSVDGLDPTELSRLAALGGASALLVPLSTGGRVVGLVEFISGQAGRHFHAGETAWLRTMANQAAAALENASLVRQLRDAAETDLVTGVYSHRHLQDRIRQETARAARSGSPLSVLMLDLDDFKRVNDEHGHQAGDRVLRAIAGALRAAVRTSDVVARYGGDEFVVLMPDTDAAEAAHVAQRASESVAGLTHPMTDGSEVCVSCSVGLALHPRDGVTARELLRGADAAMYSHKRARSEAGRASRAAPTEPGTATAAGVVAGSAGPRSASVTIRPERGVPA
jgi:diguanylate cyclase (GGDEF)-like protein